MNRYVSKSVFCELGSCFKKKQVAIEKKPIKLFISLLK